MTFIAAASFILALDQATKSLVRANLPLGGSWPSEDWLIKIIHGTNSGAAFGILQGQTVFLILTAFLATLAILVFHFRFAHNSRLLPAALGMLLGGVVGNLSDRLRFGEVTDLIYLPHYPAFNLADSSIVVGISVLLIYFVFLEPRRLPVTNGYTVDSGPANRI